MPVRSIFSVFHNNTNVTAKQSLFGVLQMCYFGLVQNFVRFVCKVDIYCLGNALEPLFKQTLDSSKLIEFADDNFKFDENGRKSPKG